MALRFIARELYGLATEAFLAVHETAASILERLPPVPETSVLGKTLWREKERVLLSSFERDNDGFFVESVRFWCPLPMLAGSFFCRRGGERQETAFSPLFCRFGKNSATSELAF